MFLRSLFAGLACLAGAVACLAAGESATASPTPTSNVPYLAWRGQQVKLVQCDIRVTYNGEVQYLDGDSLVLSGSWAVQEWSGSFGSPTVVSGPSTFAYRDADWDTTGDHCVAASLMATDPGLASVKLVLSLSTPEGPIPSEDLELFEIEPSKRLFLTAWMTLLPPVLTNLGGESAGDGQVAIGGAGDVLRATVRGSFPLGNDFAGTVPGDVATLPDQWSLLAGRLAADADYPLPGSAPFLWDLHDDTLATDGHVAGSACAIPPVTTVEAVDNCTAGGAEGPFSRVGGDLSAVPTFGPFDPLRLDATALGDGKVDAGDAPMPAARLDVSIDAAGIGSLVAVDKTVAYSRDGIGGAGAGNLFAPFYASFVPATAADPLYASGTAAGFSNNYPGFPGGAEPDGSYRFWRVAAELETGSGTNACRDPLGNLYPQQTGARRVALYTDEHGEARVRFVPGTGLWLVPDANNRCDLGPVIGPPAPLDPAQVTARAVYPGEPVIGAPPAVSSPVSFQRGGERAGFSLTCMGRPGFPFPETRVCFAQVIDPLGNPIPDAQIRFSRSGDAASIHPNAITLAGFSSVGQSVVDVDPGDGWATIETNAAGTASVEVSETFGTPFQVVAESLGTRFTPGSPGVTRFVASDPSVVDAASGAPGPGGTVSTGPAPSAGDPVEASVTTPTGGAVSIVERDIAPPSEAGYLLFGRQIEITAPPATQAVPLQLTFLVDASLLGAADPSTVAVFRNGVALPDCTGAGTAFPEPACVAARTPLGGGVQIDVLATQASNWWLGISLAPTNPCAGAAPVGAIVGGSGNDTINGTSGNDVIFDAGGTNKINGKGGNDLICAGSGNDKIDGGAGNDTVIDRGGKNDVKGGDGKDAITTGGGDDTIEGGSGDDTVSAGEGKNTVKGGDGKDAITTGGGDDTIEGGSGDDTVSAGEGKNTVKGGDGKDAITTGGGDDTIEGGSGDDTVSAGEGKNTVKGGDGKDAITTGGGDDTIEGGSGDDTVSAGEGKNTVKGGDGKDAITTGAGEDTIDGGSGFDTCDPGGGTNTVSNCEA